MEQCPARDVSHEARAGGGEAGALDALGEIVENLACLAALSSKFRVEPLGEHVRPTIVRRRVGNGVEIGERMIERLPAERSTVI